MACQCSITIIPPGADLTACCPDMPVQIPATAFADVDNPTIGEVFSWYSSNAPFSPNTLLTFSKTDDENQPDYVWMVTINDYIVELEKPAVLEDGGSISLQTIVVDPGAFADINNPTNNELKSWAISNNHTDVGTTFVYEDFAWFLSSTNTYTRIEKPYVYNLPSNIVIDDVNFADPNQPTQIEIDNWVASQSSVDNGTRLIVTGTGSSLNPDFIWVYQDSISTNIKYRYSEQTIPLSTKVIVPSSAFSTINQPTINELIIYINDNSIEVIDGSVLVFNETRDTNNENKDFVWIYSAGSDEYTLIYETVFTNDIVITDDCCPSDAQAVPISAFADDEAPTVAEVNTWATENGPFGPGTVLKHDYPNENEPAWTWILDGSLQAHVVNQPSNDWTRLIDSSTPNSIDIFYPDGTEDMITIENDTTALEQKLDSVVTLMESLALQMQQLVTCSCNNTPPAGGDEADVGLTGQQISSSIPTADLSITGSQTA